VQGNGHFLNDSCHFRQVKYKLEKGSAVLIFDDKTKTTNLFLADDPILKKLDAST